MGPNRPAEFDHASARMARQTAMIEFGARVVGLITAAVLLLTALIGATTAVLIHLT